jgi:hypothetical protein
MKGERCPNDPFAYQSREKGCSATDPSLSLNLDQMLEYKLNSGHISQLSGISCAYCIARDVTAAFDLLIFVVHCPSFLLRSFYFAL